MGNLYSNKSIIDLLNDKYKIKISRQRLHQLRTGAAGCTKILVENLDFYFLSDGGNVIYSESAIDKIVEFINNCKRNKTKLV